MAPPSPGRVHPRSDRQEAQGDPHGRRSGDPSSTGRQGRIRGHRLGDGPTPAIERGCHPSRALPRRGRHPAGPHQHLARPPHPARPGALVEAWDAGAGSWEELWAGTDPTPADELATFSPDLAPVAFATDRLRITLDTDLVPGFNEIDAVELVGTPQ